jgi:uncharacterized protein YegL
MNEEFRNYDVQPINILRTNPLGIIFLLDQSGSMSESFGGDPNLSKAQGLADAVNKVLQNLVAASRKEMGKPPYDYFFISIIGYGYEPTEDSVGLVFGENIAEDGMVPISKIAENPLRVEKRKKQKYVGAGENITEEISFPVWFDPVSVGGTPMCKALRMAKDTAEKWVNSHPNCLPPIVFNFTDGESTDGDPEPVAEEIKKLSNQYGNVLLFNLHLSKINVTPISFQNKEDNLPDEFAKKPFRMSSIIPRYMIRTANEDFDLHLPDDAHGFVLNECTAFIMLISFLSIGGALHFFR